MIVEHSLLMVWRADVNGGWDFASENWLDFTGRELNDELGAGWWERVHPDDCPHARRGYLRAIARREPFQLLLRLRRFDDEERWVLLRGAPAASPDDGLVYVGSALDVTNDVVMYEVVRAPRAG